MSDRNIEKLKKENKKLRRHNKLLVAIRDAARGFYGRGPDAAFDRNRAIDKACTRYEDAIEREESRENS